MVTEMSMTAALPSRISLPKVVSKLLKFTPRTTGFPRRKGKAPGCPADKQGSPSAGDLLTNLVVQREKSRAVKWQCGP